MRGLQREIEQDGWVLQAVDNVDDAVSYGCNVGQILATRSNPATREYEHPSPRRKVTVHSQLGR